VYFFYLLFGFIIFHGHIFRHFGFGPIDWAFDYFATSDMKGHRSYTEQMVRLLFACTLLPANVVNLPDTAKLGAAPQYKYKYRHLQYTLYLSAQHQYIIILHNEM